MEDENDTVTRARLAEVWKVSLPTIDDWVRRGCPIHKEGDKGKACEFSLIAVKKWRVRDLLFVPVQMLQNSTERG